MTIAITPAEDRAGRYEAKMLGKCVHGHDLTEDNIYWVNGKTRKGVRCKTCRRERNREDRKRYMSKIHTDPGITVLPASPNDGPGAYPEPEVDWDWTDRAACKGAGEEIASEYEDVFFASDQERGMPVRSVQAAEDYCARCPVLEQCAATATARRDQGLWGGSWRSIDSGTKRYKIVDLLRSDNPDEGAAA